MAYRIPRDPFMGARRPPASRLLDAPNSEYWPEGMPEPPWMAPIRAKQEAEQYLEGLKRKTDVAQQQAKFMKAQQQIAEMKGPQPNGRPNNRRFLQRMADTFLEPKPVPELPPEQQHRMRIDEQLNLLRERMTSPTPEQALNWTRESPEFQDYITEGGDMDRLRMMRLEEARRKVQAEQGGGVEISPGVSELWSETDYHPHRRRAALGRSRMRTQDFYADWQARRQAAQEEMRLQMPPSPREMMDYELEMTRARYGKPPKYQHLTPEEARRAELREVGELPTYEPIPSGGELTYDSLKNELATELALYKSMASRGGGYLTSEEDLEAQAQKVREILERLKGFEIQE